MAKDIQATAAWRDYGAHVLLDRIEVPGTAYVTELAARTRTLPEASVLAPWCEHIEDLLALGSEGVDALAEEQRAIAADRTQLCRGISQQGPLPPYEAYYREGASVNDVTAAYHAAGVRFDGAVERDDYLGTELAFLAFLAHAETAAHEQGDETAEAALTQQRRSFEHEHLAWAEAFCTAALPYASTSYFKAALNVLTSRIG